MRRQGFTKIKNDFIIFSYKNTVNKFDCNVFVSQNCYLHINLTNLSKSKVLHSKNVLSNRF